MSGSACGLHRSENAGMSSENYVGIIMAENLRFLGAGSSAQGKPEAKARPEGVVEAQQADIPAPRWNRHERPVGRGDFEISPGAGRAGGREGQCKRNGKAAEKVHR